MSKAFRFSAILSAAAALLGPNSAPAQPPCTALLKYGIHDHENIRDDIALSERVIQWFRQFRTYEEAQKASSSLGFNLLSIISLDFSGDEEGWRRFRESIETFYGRNVEYKRRYSKELKTVS